MSRADKIPLLQAKARDLISWFYLVQKPTEPVPLKTYMRIIDLETFIFCQLSRMQVYYADPYNTTFVSAYRSLQELKNYIECTTQSLPA